MKKIIFYLHVHQPDRLKEISVFDIGNDVEIYRENPINKQVFDKISKKSYLPMNKLLLQMLNEIKDFKVNLSITGTFIEQCEKYSTEVLESFIKLTKTGKTEILGETYYHSLASMYSINEFEDQVREHTKKIQEVFGQTPIYFRNTELIYSNEIAQKVQNMGFKGVITEGIEKILGWQSPNYIYQTDTDKPINLALKNYKLSDDIAWRFSNKGWEEHPLSSEKYLHWLENSPGEVINLFMDYETFGEHQWEDTGIFNFFESFVNLAIKNGNSFMNFKEINRKVLSLKGKISVPYYISWADSERDTSAWTENPMQQDTLNKIYQLEEQVKNTGNNDLLILWKKMQTSDHFYYMCTKWFNDGDAHAYFSPYKNPYEAYNYYNHALIHLVQKVSKFK